MDTWKGAFHSLGGQTALMHTCLDTSGGSCSNNRKNHEASSLVMCGSVGDHRRDQFILLFWRFVVGLIMKGGGLHLRNLVSKNITLDAKWLWQFPLGTNPLWHQIQSKV